MAAGSGDCQAHLAVAYLEISVMFRPLERLGKNHAY